MLSTEFLLCPPDKCVGEGAGGNSKFQKVNAKCRERLLSTAGQGLYLMMLLENTFKGLM